MRLAFLSHVEAADPAVVANVAAHLMNFADGPTVVTTAPLATQQRLTPALECATAPAIEGIKVATPLDPVAAFSAPLAAVVAQQPIAPAAITPPTPPAASIPAPPSVSAAAAPVVPEASAAQPASALDVDTRGYPWDSRIHASTKTKNKGDGTWRQKRETPGATVQGVEAELRAKHGIAEPAPVAPPPPPALPTGPNSVFALGAAAAPPVTPGAAVPTFGDMMTWATPYMISVPPKLDQNQLRQVMGQCGVEGMPELMGAKAGMVPTVWAALRALVGE